MNKIVFEIEPFSFTATAFLIGLLLTQELSLEEQDSVGNWLQLVGQTMQTYAAQYTTLSSNDSTQDQNKNDDNSSDIETLKKAIQKIEAELNKLTKKD